MILRFFKRCLYWLGTPLLKLPCRLFGHSWTPGLRHASGRTHWVCTDCGASYVSFPAKPELKPLTVARRCVVCGSVFGHCRCEKNPKSPENLCKSDKK